MVKWINFADESIPGVEHKTYFSNTMKQEIGYSIYLPPRYKETEERFPAVYSLHGRGGDESSNLLAAKHLGRAIQSGKTRLF